ncbi:MAG: hypothetical protein PHN54_00880 [Bacilli bacterium]|nr:hypothetical protein [Bacilli bacterium]
MNKTIDKVVSNMNMEGFNITKEEGKKITDIALNDVKNKKLSYKQFVNIVKDLEKDKSLLMTLWEQFGKDGENKKR